MTTAKTYVVQRRLPDGKTRRLTVGAVGEFAKVEDARRKAGTLLAGLRDGKDPKAERKKEAARDRTLQAWVDLYLTSRKSLSPRSIEEYQRSVQRHLEPWVDRPLREITPDMVEDRHAAIGKASGPPRPTAPCGPCAPSGTSPWIATARCRQTRFAG